MVWLILFYIVMDMSKSNPVLFIHGFASIGRGVKSLQLQEILNTKIIAPDLDHQPLQDLEKLQHMIETHHVSTVIGSSLGGFYGLLLAFKNPINLILINPAVRSPQTLQKYIGIVERFNGEIFQWSQEQIDELAQLAIQIEPENLQRLDQSKILILLARQDEVLDYRDAEQLLQGAKIILDEQEDHRFAKLQPYADLIRSWLI